MSRRKDTNTNVAGARVTAQERAELELAAARLGFGSVGEYLLQLHRERAKSDQASANALAEKHPANAVRPYHRTALGTVLCGNALGHLHHAPAQSVDLVVTSPPFGLVRKKSYGNEDAHRYCDWFRPFAAGFRRILKENGSLVIDIGGA